MFLLCEQSSHIVNTKLTDIMPTRLLLDPWSADYPGSVQAATPDLSQSDVQIDLCVETQKWSATPPGKAAESAAFVDGVRRLEARVIGLRQDGMIHGLFASFATGATVVSPKDAVFAYCAPTRRLILTSGVLHSEVFRIGNCDLRFEGQAVPDENPDALLLALQSAMRQAEQELAEALPAPLVFLDGPIAFTTETPGPVVGVVKSIHRFYLSPEQMDIALHLKTGERTPVFAIREGQKTRYSWYLRIAERRPTHHAFSGVIRLEVGAAGGIDKGVTLAEMSGAFLPRFASSANRDARAPQNLTPVGALEQHLRNQMGDTTLIHRAIERRISEGLTL
jgi:uncharacterized protein